MSAPSPVTNYIVEVPKDDPRHTIPGFSPYSSSPVSPAAVREALAEQDQDLASIQLAHYWLQTDRWIRSHNAEVEEAEKKRKEEEDMRKLAEKKKAEIVEDQRQRAEQEEKERWRKEKGKGKKIVSEAGPSSPRKGKATEEPGNAAAKQPKVSEFPGFGVILTNCSLTRRNIAISRRILRLIAMFLRVKLQYVSITPKPGN